MGKGGFVRGDDTRTRMGGVRTVEGNCHDEDQLRKGTRRLCDADIVDPDDVFVGFRNLDPIEVVVVEIGERGAAALMRGNMAVSGGSVVVGRIRLVHVFRRERCRHRKPRHQGGDGQAFPYRHRRLDYMLPWAGAPQSDEEFRIS